MVKWLIRGRLAAFEKKFGYDTSYMRAMLDTDLGAFLRFARVTGISTYRRDAPLALYHAAKLTAVLAEDCGPCTQLLVGMALADGLDGATIARILEGDESKMSDEACLGVRFARAALAHDPAADELRDEVSKRWGQRAVISLAFALVAARTYPTVKYALGYGKTCQKIVVEGTAITPRHA
jgi:hypothetical protein